MVMQGWPGSWVLEEQSPHMASNVRSTHPLGDSRGWCQSTPPENWLCLAQCWHHFSNWSTALLWSGEVWPRVGLFVLVSLILSTTWTRVSWSWSTVECWCWRRWPGRLDSSSCSWVHQTLLQCCSATQQPHSCVSVFIADDDHRVNNFYIIKTV